jgi:tRNA (guanine-N7-)-methyltransferase
VRKQGSVLTNGNDQKPPSEPSIKSRAHRSCDTKGEPFGGFGKTFGRRQGRPLTDHHASLVENLLPRISVELPREQGVIKEAALVPQSLFGKGDKPAKDIWLEIGYGGGEHLAGQAEKNPNVGLIGGEFFTQGVAKLLALIEERDLSNIRLYKGDARELLACLHDASLSRVFVLYPDPWPKKRHARRRFISPWSVDEFARLVKPGGEVRVASDIPIYIRWTLEHFSRNEAFEWMAQGPQDWREPYDDWVSTRYEAKALREGRRPTYLTFKRV